MKLKAFIVVLILTLHKDLIHCRNKNATKSIINVCINGFSNEDCLGDANGTRRLVDEVIV